MCRPVRYNAPRFALSFLLEAQHCSKCVSVFPWFSIVGIESAYASSFFISQARLSNDPLLLAAG